MMNQCIWRVNFTYMRLMNSTIQGWASLPSVGNFPAASAFISCNLNVLTVWNGLVAPIVWRWHFRHRLLSYTLLLDRGMNPLS